ncbi:DUF1015 domain-containing protein [Streptomyces calidiresistens]|uniref:DUF1015 family protein n=1 Tax=Streptomyces calidiresistens TaxID=1485586 RepID=A0A7W3T5P0_9ACTN|nr:DUF1015 domain-containing protein [Streptomyces calidiresistens]MBB0231389.1 DUF1015 family protein [Streptomyces calidiresistens]
MRIDGLQPAPFRALRYASARVGGLAAVTSPPYDVVVRPDGLRELRSSDPHNIVHLTLPGNGGEEDGHARARATLHEWVRDGVLIRDAEPALYVYAQEGNGLSQRGVIATVPVTDPETGVILPHEDVMPDVVAERAALLRTTEAHLEPLLLTYPGEPGPEAPGGPTATVIERVTARPPLTDIRTDDGMRHRLWALTDPADHARIRADLSRCRALIADGHHRWAAYRHLRDENPSGAGGDPDDSPRRRGLVLLVDSTRHSPEVRAIHRVLPGLPLDRALALAGKAFRVGPALPAGEATALLRDTPGPALLLTDGRPAGGTGEPTAHLVDRPAPELLAARIPGDRPEAWRLLDATVLHGILLPVVWGVADSAEEIRYLHDRDSALAAAARAGGTAVLMRPVAERTVRELAEQGVTMPRKSTSFGPKPATGLVLRPLWDEV